MSLAGGGGAADQGEQGVGKAGIRATGAEAAQGGAGDQGDHGWGVTLRIRDRERLQSGCGEALIGGEGAA